MRSAFLIVFGCASSLWCGLAFAQDAHPFYSQDATVASSYQHFFVPRAQRFVQSAQQLEASIAKLCEMPSSQLQLSTTRQSFSEALQDWTGLSAITLGPLAQRRSVREIDFAPVREQALLQAAALSPAPDVSALRASGSGLKGFSALELLLWREAAKPAVLGSATCRYANSLAAHIASEASAISDGFAALAAQPAQGEAAQAAFAELYNQWLGAVEKLRWAQIGKPLKEAQTRGKPPAFARAMSGQTRDVWVAHASSLQALAERAISIPSKSGKELISLDSYLRGQGQLKLADQLQVQLSLASRAVQVAAPAKASTAARASQQLGQLKSLVQGPLADAVKVSIGFSDADGD